MQKKLALVGIITFACLFAFGRQRADAELIAASNLVTAVADNNAEIDLQWTTLSSTSDHGTGDNTPYAFPRSAITYDVYRDTTNSFQGKTTAQIQSQLAAKLVASQIPQDQDANGMPTSVYVYWSDYTGTSNTTSNWSTPSNGVTYYYCIIVKDNEDSTFSNPSNIKFPTADNTGPSLASVDTTVPIDGAYIQTLTDITVKVNVTEAVALANGNLTLNYKFDSSAILGAGVLPDDTASMTITGTAPNFVAQAVLPVTEITTEANAHWWITGTDNALGNAFELFDLTVLDGNALSSALMPSGQGITSNMAFDYTIHDDPAQIQVDTVALVGTPLNIDAGSTAGFTVRVGVTNTSAVVGHGATVTPAATDLIIKIGGVDKTSEFTVTPPAGNTVAGGASGNFDYAVKQTAGTTVGALVINVNNNRPAAIDTTTTWDAADVDGATTPSSGDKIIGTLKVIVHDSAVSTAKVGEQDVAVGYIELGAVGETVQGIYLHYDTAATDIADLDNVLIYADTNPKNGALDAAEITAGPLTTDTTVTATDEVYFGAETIAAGVTKQYIIAYDITNGAGMGGNTLATTINDDDAQGTGATTSASIVSTGAGDTFTTTTLTGYLTFSGADLALTQSQVGDTDQCVARFDVTPTAEGATATSLDVTVTTSGASVTSDLTNVKIYYDDDLNDVYDGTEPLAATQAAAASVLFDNFNGAGNPGAMTAGTPYTYFICYDVKATATGGHTYAAAITASTLHATGASSAETLSSTSSNFAGGNVTIYGDIELSDSGVIGTNGVPRGTSNFAMGYFELTAVGESMDNIRVTVDVDPLVGALITDVNAVKIFRDDNHDETLDADEIASSLIISYSTPASNPVTLTFPVSEVVAAGTPKQYIVALDIKSSVVIAGSKTVSADIDGAAGDIVADGVSSNKTDIATSADSLDSNDIVITGAITATAMDVAAAGAGRGIDYDNTELPILTGRLDVQPSGENVTGASVQVVVVTTDPNVVADINNIRIFVDGGDGVYDAGLFGDDVLRGVAGAVTGNDTITLNTGAPWTLTSGTTYTLWIAYDIQAAAIVGHTFSTSVAAAGITGAGVTTAQSITAAGTDLTGSTIKIGAKIAVVLDDLTTANLKSGSVDNPIMRIRITPAAESIQNIAITVTNEQDYSYISELNIYYDTNGNGTLESGEISAGAVASDTSITASETYTLSGQSISTGVTKGYILTYDISNTTFTLAKNIQATIAYDSVAAAGVTSGVSLTSVKSAADLSTTARTVIGTVAFTATDKSSSTVNISVTNKDFLCLAVTAQGERFNFDATGVTIAVTNPNGIAAAAGSVKIYYDANGNCAYDIGETLLDSQDRGVLVQFDLDATGEYITAGSTKNYIITADITNTGQAAPIIMAIAATGVDGTGDVTTAVIASNSTIAATAGTYVIGTLVNTASDPAGAPTTAQVGDTCNLRGKSVLVAAGENVTTTLTVQLQGTYSVTDLSRVAIYEDGGNTTFDSCGADDILVVETTTISSSMNLSLGAVAIGTHTYWVVFDVAAAAAGGHTVGFTISNTGASGPGVTSTKTITSTGASVTTATTKIYGSFAVDSADISETVASMGQAHVQKAWVEITATGEGITNPILPLTVTAGAGTIAAADFSALKIYRDNGSTAQEWDSTDTLVKTDASVTVGTELETLTGETIAAGTSQTYIITYDIHSSTATPGHTFDVQLTANNVDGTGQLSAVAIDATPGGTDIDTVDTTIAGALTFSAVQTATGSLSINGTRDLAYITLTAGTEQIDNTTVDIQVDVTATDYADITNFLIYVDDGDLVFEPGAGDGAPVGTVAPGATVSFTNLAIGAIAASNNVHLWLAAAIPGTAVAGHTLTTSITASNVKGDGAVSGETITAVGNNFTGTSQKFAGRISLTMTDASGLFGGISQPNVQLVHVNISSPDENINTIVLTIDTTGTTAVSDISNLKVYRDTSGNGTLSEAEIAAGYVGTMISSPVAGNNTYNLTGESISAGSSKHYVITADIASGATLLDTIQVTVAADGVTGNGISSGATITSTGTDQSGDVDVAGYLALNGTNRAATTVGVGTIDYVTGLLTLGATGEAIGTLGDPIEIIVTTSGTVPVGNLTLYIYADIDRDGELDADEKAAGALDSVGPGIVGTDTMQFPGDEQVGAGTTKDYLVVYDIADTTNVNATLQTTVAATGGSGGGAASGAAITSSGSTFTSTSSKVVEKIEVVGYTADGTASVSVPATSETGASCVFAGRVTVEVDGGGTFRNVNSASMTVTTTATSLSDITGLYIFKEPDGGDGTFNATACAAAPDDTAVTGANPDTSINASESYLLGTLTHGEIVTYYIAYRLAATATGGHTFKAGVAVTGVTGTGAGTALTITSSGATALDPTATEIYGKMTTANAEITNSTAGLGQEKVAKAYIDITAVGENITDPIFPITITGTAVAGDFTDLKIYRDNGTTAHVLDDSDTLVLTDTTVTVGLESQTLTGQTLTAGSTMGYIIAFDIAPTAVIGHAFDVQMAINSITGTGAGSAETITATFTALVTTDTTIVGGVTFAGTNMATGSTSVSATDVPLVKFVITSTDEAISANTLAVTSTLTVGALADLSDVLLYIDGGNGTFDAGGGDDVLAASVGGQPGSTTVAFASGTITHPILNTGSANAQTYWLAVDIAGGAIVGHTVAATISPTNVKGTGATSGTTLTSTGSSITSSNDTIAGTLTISDAADLTGDYNSIGAGVANIPFGRFRLTAAHESISSLAVTINTITPDISNVAVIKVYADTVNVGVLDDSEIAAGAINEIADPTGTDIIELTGQTVTTGTNKNYIVALDLASSAVFGQTVDMSIAATGVTGTGVSTSLAVTSVASGDSLTILDPPSIGGAIQIANTSLSPTYFSVGSVDVPLTAIALTAHGESMQLGSVDIDVNLEVNAASVATDVAAVKLYTDSDQDGLLNASEIAAGPVDSAVPVGGAATEIVTLDLTAITVVANVTQYYIVTINLKDNATIGDFVRVTIGRTGDVTGIGQTSALTCESYGTAFDSSQLYIREGLKLTASAPTTIPTIVTAGQTNVTQAAVKLEAFGGTVNNVKIGYAITAVNVSDVYRMKLYADAAPYGSLGTTETTAGAIATVTNPTETGTFNPTTSQSVTTASAKYYLVVMDVASAAVTDDTISVTIDGTGATGVNASLQSIASTGTTHSSEVVTVVGSLSITISDIAPASASEGRTDVAMACVTITAGSGEGVQDMEINVGTTATDVGDLNLKIYADSTTTGTCSLSAEEIAAEPIVTETNVAASVTLALTDEALAASQSNRYIIAYDVKTGATIGNTFKTSVAGAAVTGVGVITSENLTSTGTAITHTTTTIAGSLTASLADMATVNYVSTSQAGVVLEKFTVSMPSTSGESTDLTGLKISVNGATTTAADIAKVYVYLDDDGDGAKESTDTLLNAGGSNFVASPTTVTFGAAQTLDAGDSVSFFIVADVASSAVNGHTFGLTVASPAHILNTGATTAVQLLPVEITGSAANIPVVQSAAGLVLTSVSVNRIKVKPGLTPSETEDGLIVTFTAANTGVAAINISDAANTFTYAVAGDYDVYFTAEGDSIPATIAGSVTSTTFSITYSTTGTLPSGKAIVVDGSITATDANSGTNVSVAHAGTTITIASDSTAPTISSVVAYDGTTQGNGIDSDDYVLITFNEAMFPVTIDASNINTVLHLNNSHSWLNSLSQFGTAAWESNYTKLRIVFSAITGTAKPTVAPDDIITTTLTDVAGNVVSGTGTITGTFDDLPAEISSATLVDLETLTVVFNEPLTSSTATTNANYAVTGGGDTVLITGAAYASATYTVTLSFSGMTSNPGIQYTLTINDVKDIAGNPMTNVTVQFTQTTNALVNIANSSRTLADPEGAQLTATFAMANNSDLVTVTVTVKDAKNNPLQGALVKLSEEGDSASATVSTESTQTYDFSALPKILTTGSDGKTIFNVKSSSGTGVDLTTMRVSANSGGTYTALGNTFTMEFGVQPTILLPNISGTDYIQGLANGDVIPKDGNIKLILSFSDVSALPSTAGRGISATSGSNININAAFDAYIDGSAKTIAAGSECSGTTSVTCVLYVDTDNISSASSHTATLNVLDRNGRVIRVNSGDDYTYTWTGLQSYDGFSMSKPTPTAALYNPLTGRDGQGNQVSASGIGLTVQTTNPITSAVVRIYSRTGQLVRTLYESNSGAMDTGFVVVAYWDGRDQSGAVVPNGSYTYVISATASSAGTLEAKGKVTIWK